jgi:PIN domain nuclease of toxin-antitoxin system
MSVLIDTHTFLWIAADLEKLSNSAREVCSSEQLVLSIASVWEISIKCHIARLKLPAPRRRLHRETTEARIDFCSSDSVPARCYGWVAQVIAQGSVRSNDRGPAY